MLTVCKSHMNNKDSYDQTGVIMYFQSHLLLSLKLASHPLLKTPQRGDTITSNT